MNINRVSMRLFIGAVIIFHLSLFCFVRAKVLYDGQPERIRQALVQNEPVMPELDRSGPETWAWGGIFALGSAVAIAISGIFFRRSGK